MDPDVLYTLIIGLIAGALALLWRKRNLNLPPGPIGLPILGYLPFLGRKGYEELHRLTLKYGPVYSFYLGRKLVVVLGSFKTAKEVLTRNEFLDRPDKPPNHLLPNSTSLTVSNGHIWKEQRQFSVQLLRQLGMGTKRMEEIIQEEIKFFLEQISSKNGKAFNLDTILIPSVSNNVYSLLCGKRLDYEDEERHFLNKVMNMMTMYFRPTILHAYFPFLKWWLARLKIWGYHRVEQTLEEFGTLVEKKMSQCVESGNMESVSNYFDGFMLNMHNQKSPNYTKGMLKGNFLSIFGAGSTPGRATVAWALVCMVQHPEIQLKVQAELDKVIGANRQPSWTDRHNLPYTVAVIREVMRSNSTVPISMLRCASEDTKISNYDIPKGTFIMTNIWGVHHNPDYFSDPHLFQPERFLKDGKLVKVPALIPFSYGKRNCPGEDLANMLVFLYFSSVLKNFTICLPPDSDGTFKEDIGIAKLVKPDNVCLKRRTTEGD